MNTLSWLVDDSFATSLTVALLHFLWQGCCIGLLVMALGALLNRASARLRYSLNVVCLLLMAACLPVTFLLVSSPVVTNRPLAAYPAHAAEPLPSTGREYSVQPGQQVAAVPSHVIPVDDLSVARNAVVASDAPLKSASSKTISTDWIRSLSSLLAADTLSVVARWVAPLYLLGVGCILGRLVIGMWGSHQLRSLAIPIKDEILLASFQKLAYRVGLPMAPSIAWCKQISVPIVVGIVKPMILLPLAVVSSLTPDQLQALVLHELSHIRRYDPIVNLLQRIVEAVLFFHPMVWLVSRRISLERELAADDMVLAAGWDRPRYADALVRMAELAAAISGRSAKPSTVLAATGTNPSEFKLRILRLLDASRPPELALSRMGILLVLSLILVSGAFAWSQAPRKAADDPDSGAAADAEPRDSDIQRARGEADDANRLLAAVANKLDPTNSVLTTIDNGPANQSRAVIKQLDEAGDTKLASLARERLAQRWKRISEQPVLSFTRPPPLKDPGRKEVNSGDTVGVQTELDGVWSEGKGAAENWVDWIRRKQDDYRSERLQLLFAAAQGFRKVDDATGAERVLTAGLAGHEIYDADLKSLVKKYWPVTSNEPAKSLGSGPQAWTLVNNLQELSSVQQALGKTEAAISTHSRLTLAHFLLSWQHPSAGPTKHARELWTLIRQQKAPLPPLFWFNLVDEKKPQQEFDLSTAGKKGEPLTYHHQNLAAAPPLEFKELIITAKTNGRQGFLDCYRINGAGKHETIGLLELPGKGESDQEQTKKLAVPPGTSLVQFMVAGEGFQVKEMKVAATFAPQDKGPGAPPAMGAAPEVGLGQRQDVVHWSHDSQQLYATGDFSKLTLWERKETGWQPQLLKAEHHANSLAASRKSPLLVAGTNVGTAEAWDVTTQKRLSELRSSPDYSVYAVAISSDDKLIAACGTDGTVQVFDRESAKPIMALGEKADTRMASLAFAPDGKTLAAMDRYGHLVLWKLSEKTRLAEWKGIGGEDCSVHWSPDSKQLAVSGWGRVTLIAAEKESRPRVVEAPEAVLGRYPKTDDSFQSGPEPGGVKFASVTAIAPDLRTAASVAPDASIGIWDLTTRKIMQTLPAPTKVAIMDSQSAGLRNLNFSPNGKRLACTTLRGEVVFWTLADAVAVSPEDLRAARALHVELTYHGSRSPFRLKRFPLHDTANPVLDLDPLVSLLPESDQIEAAKRFNAQLQGIAAAPLEQFEATVDRTIRDSRDLPKVYRGALAFNLWLLANDRLSNTTTRELFNPGSLDRIRNRCVLVALEQADELPAGLVLRLLEDSKYSLSGWKTDDDPAWPAHRRLKATLWLTRMAKVRAAVDPRWDPSDMSMFGRNMEDGFSPEARGTPEQRAAFAARVETRRRQAERYHQQDLVRKLLAELSPLMEEDLVRLYARKPLNPAELETLLNEHVPDRAQCDRVAKSVRLVNALLPAGTQLQYGWSDELAKAGPDGVPALMTAVGDKTYPSFLRHEGAWALGSIGDPRAIDTLNMVAEDEATPAKYKEIARHSVRALQAKRNAPPPGERPAFPAAPSPLPNLHLTGEEVTPEGVAKLAERSWGTVTLADARFTGEIVERLRQADSIRELRLFGTNLSGQIPRLEHITGLKSLVIDAPLTGRDLEAIGQLAQLERLSLPNELTINVSGAQEIARLVHLKSLQLSSVNIDDAAFVELRTLVGLEELDLSHTKITDEGLKTIEKMPALRVLELHRHPHLKQQLSAACLASLARLPALERLSLSGKIGNDDLKLVGRWPQLKSLSILSTEITDAGLEALEDSNIEQLTLSRHQLGDAPSALEHLKKCRKLKGIHLIGKPDGNESQWQLRLPNLDWSFTS